MGQYLDKFREAIKNSNDDNEIDNVLKKIYEDGFGDGCESGID